MGKTRRLDANSPQQVLEAARLLREGRLVAFPTETVYGLGANALSAEAVAGIFRAKQRPSWDPLIVHLARTGDRERVAFVPPQWSGRVASLEQAFWPGPLTLLLPRQLVVPDAVTAGRDTVGVRVPMHPAAQALLEAAGMPLAAPSANLFGHVSPTTAEHVLADLDGRVDAILDAGPCNVGVESTVLDPLQTPMVVYRQGAVTPAMLERASGVTVDVYRAAEVELKTSQTDAYKALPSPGVGLRHYAPRARLRLIEGHPDLVWAAASEAGQAGLTGLLWPQDWTTPQWVPESPVLVLQPWGFWNDPGSRAASLYAGLRALDERGVQTIVCPLPPRGGLDDALRDRLEKAARKTS